MMNIFPQAEWISDPLSAVVLLLLAFINWNRSRKLAVFSLCVAAFVLAACVVILFIK